MQDKYALGDFTLPGEAGYEELTLRLARRWGADVIRDSDGTRLSPEIVEAGYKIYSTICIIRQHNAFAQAHPDAQQQTFLGSRPVVAAEETVEIPLLAGYFTEQFVLNETPEALALMQVWDRTANVEVPRENWRYAQGSVKVTGCVPGRSYTANFLCYRGMGRNQHVQPYHQQLAERASAPAGPPPSRGLGLFAGLAGALVRGESRYQRGAPDLPVLQFRVDLGRGCAPAEFLHRLGQL